MDLKQTSHLTRRVILITIALIGIFVVGYLGYQYVNKANPAFGKLDKPKIQNLITKHDTVWGVNTLVLTAPNKASVLSVTKRGWAQSEATKMARSLGFSDEPKAICNIAKCEHGDNLLTWQSLEASLTIDKLKGSLTYTNPIALNKTGNNLSYTRLRSAAETFIKEKGISLEDLNSSDSDTKFYKPDSSVTTDLGQASLVELNYKRFVNGFEVRNFQNTAYLVVQITRDGKVSAMNYLNTQIEANADVTYPLLSESQAGTALKNGKGFLVNYTKTGYGSIQLVNPDSVALSTGKLFLYDDGVGDFIEPIYVFNAVAAKSLQSADAEVYLPAILDKYYSE